MTKIILSTPAPAQKVHEVVAEIFQAATIALVGVLGILTVAATFNAFYYAVTGAVVSYALTGGQWRAAALIFPMLMTFFFVLVFWKAWKLFAQAEEDIKDIAGSLGCERAEVHILTRILQCSYYMYFFNCLALLILLISKLTGLYPLD